MLQECNFTYLIRNAMTLLFYFLLQLAEDQMKEPEQTCHLQISMKVETHLILGSPSQEYETLE